MPGSGTLGIWHHALMEPTGSLLVASPLLADPDFFRTVVFLLRHDEDGALGLVVNRPSGAPVSDHLPAWGALVVDPPVVFVGGPVEPAVAVALGDRGAPTPLSGVHMVDLEAEPAATWVRVFSGYAGWGPGQLEEEIDEGSWMVLHALAPDVRTEHPEGLWHDVLRRQHGPLRMLATYPPSPELN